MILENIPLHRPKISIILPCFNKGNFIAETIQSCLNQTFVDFELIIINDCSINNSKLVVKEYLDLDNRIKFIQTEPNKTFFATLNVGFRNANGEYFTWISNGSVFHPAAFEKMTQILDNMSEFGLVYTDYTTINNKGEIKDRLYLEDLKYLPINNCIGPNFLYRSILVKQIGEYDEKFLILSDYEYWLRISLVTKLYHISESLFFYRIYNQNLIPSQKKEIYKIQNLLKEKFKNKFIIDDDLKPINDLYMCFIAKKSFKIYIKLLLIILTNPIVTLSYIMKQLTTHHYIFADLQN